METLSTEYKDLLELVPCNLCGADSYAVIYHAQYAQAKPEEIRESFRSSGDEKLIDQLVVCRHCGLKYLNPRLKQDTILDGYSSGSDETFISQAEAREKTFNKCLNIIEHYAPEKGRLLDVGTAGGSFLHVARQRGWSVAGCEPNQWLTQWAREHYQLTLQPGTIFDMDLEDESFDVVTLWDVLEHTSDPKEVLMECSRILKDKGLLVVNYPDIDSMVAKAMGRNWVFLLSIHLYYFTPATLTQLLNDVGFEVVKQKKHWQSLELDYILYRMSAYIPTISNFFRRLFKKINVGHWHVPYWMGQSLMIARKKETQ